MAFSSQLISQNIIQADTTPEEERTDQTEYMYQCDLLNDNTLTSEQKQDPTDLQNSNLVIII